MDFFKLILTTLLSYAALAVSTKLAGPKQISQLDFFDYVSGITIGSIAAELATDLESPWKSFVALVIYGVVTWGTSILGLKSGRSRRYLNGAPVIVMDRGTFFRENMKKAQLELSDFMVMCRQQGYFDLSAIETAVFEYNGKLSILPVSAQRPLTPQDMNLAPEQQHISAEVIMDGRILDKNLQRLGLDLAWLQAQLKKQGIADAKDVFLGVCDPHHNLSCYRAANPDGSESS